MLNASREAPKAIVMSVYIGAITGFIFLISVCFCIGDITTTAESTTGVPLIEIFYNSTQSVVGACFLTSTLVVIVLICANGLLAEASRSLYAFARDKGLPFSSTIAKVDPKRQVPVYAILLACVVQMALNSIYFGTLTGFNTVISIGTEGFCTSLFPSSPYLPPAPFPPKIQAKTNDNQQTPDLSYAMPLLARLTSPTTPLPGPYTLGKLSVPLNILGLLFLLFTSITFNFPTLSPVNEEDMNYTCAAIGVIALVSIATWVTTGRRGFTGPQVQVVEGVGGGETGKGEGKVEAGGGEKIVTPESESG